MYFLISGLAYSGAIANWLSAITITVLFITYLFGFYFAVHHSFKIDASRIFLIGIALMNTFLTIAGLLILMTCYFFWSWTFRTIIH